MVVCKKEDNKFGKERGEGGGGGSGKGGGDVPPLLTGCMLHFPTTVEPVYKNVLSVAI